MNTFKDFFKKHLALNLVALILPIVLYILAYSLIPKGYAHWTPFHPMILFITLSIIGCFGLVLFINATLVAKNKTKKIISITFCYIFFVIYVLGYYFIEYFIFHKKWGFIADIMQENSSLQHLITDCLYTVLAPSFVTIFVIIGVIIFTVYLIKSAKNNKQPTDTTTE